MTKESAMLASRIGLVILVVISLIGCSKQAASPKPAPKPIIHGGATPTAAVKGFMDAVREGNSQQALAYWEFPKQGEPAYEHTRDYWQKEDVYREPRERVLYGVSWSGLSPLSPGPSLRWRRRTERLLEWHFRVELFNRKYTRGAPSLEAAGWAEVGGEGTLHGKEYAAAVRYRLHKSGGRWRIVGRISLIGG